MLRWIRYSKIYGISPILPKTASCELSESFDKENKNLSLQDTSTFIDVFSIFLSAT